MTPSLLVDTDILIDVARGNDFALQFMNRAAQQGALAISIVTEMDLIVGCRNRRELKSMNTFLKRFSVIPLTPEISTLASNLLRTYRLSHGLLIADALIAATALVLKLRFASKNQKDFRFIDGLMLIAFVCDSNPE